MLPYKYPIQNCAIIWGEAERHLHIIYTYTRCLCLTVMMLRHIEVIEISFRIISGASISIFSTYRHAQFFSRGRFYIPKRLCRYNEDGSSENWL